MNDIYLDAECVVNYLVEFGLIYYNPDWKNKSNEFIGIPKIVYHFAFNSRRGNVSFEITLENGDYKVYKKSIATYQRIVQKDLSVIFTECKIE